MEAATSMEETGKKEDLQASMQAQRQPEGTELKKMKKKRATKPKKAQEDGQAHPVDAKQQPGSIPKKKAEPPAQKSSTGPTWRVKGAPAPTTGTDSVEPHHKGSSTTVSVDKGEVSGDSKEMDSKPAVTAALKKKPRPRKKEQKQAQAVGAEEPGTAEEIVVNVHNGKRKVLVKKQGAAVEPNEGGEGNAIASAPVQQPQQKRVKQKKISQPKKERADNKEQQERGLKKQPHHREQGAPQSYHAVPPPQGYTTTKKHPQQNEGGRAPRRERDETTPVKRTPMHTPGSHMSNRKEGGGDRGKKPLRPRFDDYFHLQQVEAGLKNGTLFRGKLRINARNRREAYVTVEGVEMKDIYIETQEDRNRALEGDVVIVKLHPKQKWKTLKTSVVEDLIEDFKEPIEDDDEDLAEIKKVIEEETVVATTEETAQKVEGGSPSDEVIIEEEEKEEPKEAELQPSGKIVFISEQKATRDQIGYLKPMNENEVKPDDRYALFIPTDLKVPKMLIPIGQIPGFYKDYQSFANSLVMASLASWRKESYLPLGKFIRVVGEIGMIGPETESLLIMNKVDSLDFTDAVLDSIPKEISISPDEFSKRRDLRKVRIFTIDPPTAKDLDDALSIRPLPDGNYEVGVHIADVSHFVQPGSPVDLEASKRSTTVYLVARAIPMLPNLLCENLCSLNPGVDRLAFSVMWTLKPDGEVVHEWFGKTIINSCCKLPYGAAQAVIEGKVKTSWAEAEGEDFSKLEPTGGQAVQDVIQDILSLQSIASQLRAQRFENGAVNLNNSKIGFKLDEFGNPIDSYQYVTKEANHMIEEFMLLANMRVAKKISTSFPETALLRNHTVPLDKKLEGFTSICAAHGFAVDTSSSKALATALINLKQATPPAIFSAITMLATKPMQLAKYFCTGDLLPSQWHHYALNVPYYTHFTSPIRRYPDLLVHRLLEAALIIDSASSVHDQEVKHALAGLLTQEALSKVCENANDKKYNARKAQEASADLYLAILLQKRPMRYEAVVLNMGDKWITCMVPEFGDEKRIYMEDLEIVGHYWDEKEKVLSLEWPNVPGDITAFPSIKQELREWDVIRTEAFSKQQGGKLVTHVKLLHPNTE